jgi:hypothetical protein
MQLRLINDGGDDVMCPHCHRKYSIVWDTEYGNPVIGSRIEYCTNLSCLKSFVIEVDVQTSYTSYVLLI